MSQTLYYFLESGLIYELGGHSNFVNLVCENSFPSIKIPSFLLNPFLFPDKTLSSLCQNHTRDDDEKNKIK